MHLEKYIEENQVKLEEIKLKLALQQDNLNSVKRSTEQLNNILKEKQFELKSLEREIDNKKESLIDKDNKFEKM